MTTTPSLHVTVFGATGKIGRHVVDQLLAAGHTVTAYVRNPAKLSATHPNLHVVQGELDDVSSIARAVQGADAVISALGPSLRRGTTGTPVADGTRNIVNAMHAAGVRRYIGLATPAMADERDRPTIKGKVLRSAAAPGDAERASPRSTPWAQPSPAPTSTGPSPASPAPTTNLPKASSAPGTSAGTGSDRR